MAHARTAESPAYDEEPPRRRRRPGRLLAMVLVVLLVGSVAAYLSLDGRLRSEAALADYEGRPEDTPGTNWLIVGSDSREGLTGADRRKLRTGSAQGKRTDSIMLLHYGDGGTTLLSIPRDSYVAIPGYGENKINAAYALGGSDLLARTVEQATGIRVDHFAEIGFGGFVGVVDAVGGVDICVKKPIRDPKAGLDLKAGCQELSGAQALGYVRTRKYANGDLERIKNQRQFFSALIDKATSPATLFNPFRSVPLAWNSTGNFTVDEGDSLFDLGRMMLAMRDLSGGDGKTLSVPFGRFGSSAAAGSYVVWDKAKSEKLFTALRNDEPLPDGIE
ncbi:LCP family protein [Actinocorallia populi]|uniref:LCP family protein n=1 Tax=Actinocorallia populi TaxID=2079200 RepID=UPI001E4E3F68|nr:LCP family protein [Actinocorallia populi]